MIDPKHLPAHGKNAVIADAMMRESYESGRRWMGGSIYGVVAELVGNPKFPTIASVVSRRVHIVHERRDPMHIGEVY